MTWAKLVANGSGRLRLRLMVEGWPEEFVTDPSITHATNADGRTIVSGLSYDGIQIGDRCLPWEGSVQSQGITFKVSPTYGSRGDDTTGTDPVIASLATWPDPVNSLSASWEHGSLIAPSVAIGSLTDNATYHIGTEAFRTVDDGATTRAVWDTILQSHHTSIFDDTSTVYIYDRPPTMEGRRAYLYVYGDGDDVAGDGQAVWRGVVSRPPRQHSDGVSWLIETLPVTHWLKQTVGGGIGEVKPIGLYFNWKSTFFLRVDYGTAQNVITGTADVQVAGIHTEETFIQAVNTQLATALTATGANANFDHIRLNRDSTSWYIEAKKNDSDSIYLSVTGGSNITGFVGITGGQSRWVFAALPWPSGSNIVTPITHTARFDFEPRWFNTLWSGVSWNNLTSYQGPVAQPVGNGSGILTGVHLQPDLFVSQADSVSYPSNRIYVDHDMSAAESVQVVGLAPNFGAGGDIFEVTDNGTTSVTTPSGSQSFHWIELNTESRLTAITNNFGGYCAAVLGDTEIKVIRIYSQSGSIVDFRDGLVAKSVDANDGDTPWITDEDFATWYLTGNAIPAEVLTRQFAFAKSLSVESILAPDLKLAAHFMRIESDGKIGLQPISVPSDGRASYTIDHSDILTPPTGQWPGIEPQRDGFFSSLTLQQEYDPLEDKWIDPPVTVQLSDVVATHKNRGRGKLAIKTYSTPLQKPTGEALTLAARALLRLAAVDYVTVTVQVPFTKFGVLCGDFVTLTHRLIPEGDGTRGVQNRTCMVIERRWNFDPARKDQGALVLLMPVRPVAGYAHGALVTSQTGSTTSWTITADSANIHNVYLSPALDGAVASTFTAGDYIRLVQIDSVSPTEVTGTVASVSGDTVSLTLDATWTPGSDSWVLLSQDDTTATASQLKYAHVADSSRALTSGSFARRYV